MFLIYRQPDLGTALVFAAIWLGMVFVAGIRLRHLALLGIAAGAAAPAVWFSLRGYMQERIISFAQRFLSPLGSSSVVDYNTRQALTSIGSGGLFGKGFLQGTQSQLYFLRVRHTDYIFSVLSEELGFVGALFVLLLFVILLWRILRVATTARDTFGQLIASGVAVMIFFQAFVNIGVNAGLLPVTGLTLPLVSYGGSSLWTTLIGIGLVESVALRHKVLEFAD
jgi:rod shape determining protein RodA